ncbi:MAG: peptide deformylase [Patescibacteria group bacterium]
MSIRPTTQIGNKIIRTKSKRVTAVSAKVLHVVRDLTDSMREVGLVGMAGPQIGVGLRIFVTEVRKTKARKHIKKFDPLRIFINPRIIKRSKKVISGYEGCGSVAHGGLFGDVSRAESITVVAINENGKKFTLDASGLLARIIQHEIDHLDGVVFVDRVKNTKSFMGRDEYIKSHA